MPNSSLRHLSNIYHQWVKAHPQAAEDFEADIEDLLSDSGITFDRVSARIKSWSSLKAKATKTRDSGEPAYPDPWNDIHDLVGVRVNVFHSTEIPLALQVLEDAFVVLRSIDKTAETRVSGGFGYGSHHLVLQVPNDSSDLASYQGLSFEVQVRTVLQHAWAEFEHDIRYKHGPQPLDPQVDRAFTLAAGLIELADQQFDQIAAIRLEVPQSGDSSADINLEVPIAAETLPGMLTMMLGDRFPRSRSQHYRWLEELLLANEITTAKQLQVLLDNDAISAVTKKIRYRFPPGQVRLIDDLLLQRFGEAHINRTGSTGRRAAQRPRQLRRRLAALRS